MYDMYPWNKPDSGANHDQDQTAAARVPAPRDGTARRTGAGPRNGTARHANGARHPNDDVPADFTMAIQFALDRRDNGGDAAPAGQPVTPPAARRTPQ